MADGVGPEAAGVRLESAISRTSIEPADTATLSFQLRNLTDTSVTLGFTSSCNIVPRIQPAYVGDTPPGQRPDIAWPCLTINTGITLAPRGHHTLSVKVSGTLPRPPYYTVYLAPGGYSAFAELQATWPQVSLRSAVVRFVIR